MKTLLIAALLVASAAPAFAGPDDDAQAALLLATARRVAKLEQSAADHERRLAALESAPKQIPVVQSLDAPGITCVNGVCTVQSTPDASVPQFAPSQNYRSSFGSSGSTCTGPGCNSRSGGWYLGKNLGRQ